MNFLSKACSKVKSFFKKTTTAVATSVAILTTPVVLMSPANAALDVGNLTTEISSNGDSMQTVMLAILGLAVLVVGYYMIRRLMK